MQWTCTPTNLLVTSVYAKAWVTPEVLKLLYRTMFIRKIERNWGNPERMGVD